jgi:hypothetical protein
LLTEKETGRPVIFTTTSWTGRETVADLCRLIIYQRRSRGANARPIMSIGVGSYRSRRGPVATPKFTIVDWIDGDHPELATAEPPQSNLAPDLTEHLEKRSVISPTAQSTGASTHHRRKKSASRKSTPRPSWDSDDLDDEVPC